MIDETNYTGPTANEATSSDAGASAAGTPPPAGAYAGTYPPGSYPPGTYAPPAAQAPSWYQQLPSPVIAGLLGFIPGVGAMYNGQFAKGIAHIVIFIFLDALSKASGVFGVLVAGWVFYQAFEAYHTARARRDGLPLPDPFGLNDIGERLGIKGNWTGGKPWNYPTPGAPTPGAPAQGAPTQSAPWTPPAPGPIITPPPAGYAAAPGTFDAGYNPAAAANAYATQQPVVTPSTGWQNVPPPYTAQPPVTPLPPIMPPTIPPPSRFPAAAVWLIGLGLVFLIMTMTHNRVDFADLVPFLLAALGIWLIVRKLLVTGGLGPTEADGEYYAGRLADCVTGGGILLVVAVLLGLQQFSSLSMGRSWPVLVIAVGVFALLRRTPGPRVIAMPDASTPPAVASNPPAAASSPSDPTQGGR